MPRYKQMATEEQIAQLNLVRDLRALRPAKRTCTGRFRHLCPNNPLGAPRLALGRTGMTSASLGRSTRRPRVPGR